MKRVERHGWGDRDGILAIQEQREARAKEEEDERRKDGTVTWSAHCSPRDNPQDDEPMTTHTQEKELVAGVAWSAEAQASMPGSSSGGGNATGVAGKHKSSEVDPETSGDWAVKLGDDRTLSKSQAREAPILRERDEKVEVAKPDASRGQSSPLRITTKRHESRGHEVRRGLASPRRRGEERDCGTSVHEGASQDMTPEESSCEYGLCRMLRHQARNLGLGVRPDGFVKVDDLLLRHVSSLCGFEIGEDQMRHLVKLSIKKRRHGEYPRMEFHQHQGVAWVRAVSKVSMTEVKGYMLRWTPARCFKNDPPKAT